MQQTTINLPSSSPVRAMTGLAKVLALPAEHAPTRLPSYPALERTAVVGFNQPTRLIAANTDDTKLMLARQACYPAWASTTGTNGEVAAVSYTSEPNPTGTVTSADALTYDFHNAEWEKDGPQTATSGTVGLAGTTWEFYPLGMDPTVTGSHLPFAPMFAGAANYILLHATGGYAVPAGNTMTVTLICERWVAPGEVEPVKYTITVAASTTGNAVFLAPVPFSDEVAWVRPMTAYLTMATGSVVPLQLNVTIVAAAGPTSGYATSATVMGTVTSSLATSNRAFRPIIGPAEFGVSDVPYQSTRITAISLLCTNVTQVLNKNGTIMAGRLNPRTKNPFTANEADIMGLHPAEKAWLPLETGLYMYCPPSTDLVEFMDYTHRPSRVGAQGEPVYRLDNDSLVNVAFLQSGGGINSNMALTTTLHLEFRTTSALFQIALSGYTLETLHVAQLALAAAGFFFENPEHKPVLQRIVAGIKKLEPFVTPAMQVLKMTPYGNAAAAAYNAARAAVKTVEGPKKIAVKSGPTKMKATSASSSGITQSKKKKGGPGKGKKR